MKSGFHRQQNVCREINGRFLEFMKLFGRVDAVAGLFPRECRVCRTMFASVEEYCGATSPKGHCFEDCRSFNATPVMMLYRHCTCGNTLVLTLTEEEFPGLDSFWQMLQDEAEESGRSVKEVAADFADQCDRYMLRPT